MTAADRDFAVCCAVPVDADGLTIVARRAGRPGEAGASFSGKYGQSTGVCLFERVFVSWERVFCAGEWQHAGEFLYNYTAQHRHTCIAARAGFGDLLIGAGALVTEANGVDLDRASGLREAMIELIKITEGFYACGWPPRSTASRATPGSSRPIRSFPTSASCCSPPRFTTCTGSRTTSRAA